MARVAVWRICTIFSVFFWSVQGGSFEAPCPEDSRRVEDSCMCNHELCVEPKCDGDLRLLSNATDIPGQCCPRFSCMKCKEGGCACPPESSPDHEGECRCDDEQKTLVGDMCVCDDKKCPSLRECDSLSVPVKKIEGCCKIVECITCPQDSYLYHNNDEQVEDKCVCFPCSKPTCADHEIPISKRKGLNFPGFCCDLYECANKSCQVNGTFYYDGDTWMSPTEGTCKCQNGISFCTNDSEQPPSSCTLDGKIYPHLSTWAVDTCTNCTCIAGEAKCIAHLCEMGVEVVSTECPPLVNCAKTCDYGFKLNKLGCEVCKCKHPKPYEIRSKYPELVKVLDLNNIDEHLALELIQEFLRRSLENPTQHHPTNDNPSCHGGTNIMCYIFTGFMVGLIFCCGLSVLFYKSKKLPFASYLAMEKKPGGEVGEMGKQCKYELQPITDYSIERKSSKEPDYSVQYKLFPECKEKPVSA